MSKSKKAMFLQDWKEQVGENMEQFHEGAALMVRKHQKSNIKTATFAATLHDMAQHELCPSIKTALDCLSTELTAAELARTQLLSQLQAHIVNEFAKYPHKLKVQEVNIRARNKAFEKFVKKQKAFVALKGNARPERQALAKENFDHERQRLHSAEQTLNNSLCQFETARVKEMQAMLKKYISGQIHFFGKSIEGLSLAYAKVCEIDGEREGERLVEEMKKLEALEQKDDHPNTSHLDAQLPQPTQPGLPIDPAAQQMGYGQPQPAVQSTQQPAGYIQPQQTGQPQPFSLQSPQPTPESQRGYIQPLSPPQPVGYSMPAPVNTQQVGYTAGQQPMAMSPTYSTQSAIQQQPALNGMMNGVNGANSSGYGYGYGNANRYSGQNITNNNAAFPANGYTLNNMQSEQKM